jgi:hypothetical protein
VGVGEGVKVGREVSEGVKVGKMVEVGVPVEARGTGPVQLASIITMHRPKRVLLVYMEMLITRDGRGVNEVNFNIDNP